MVSGVDWVVFGLNRRTDSSIDPNLYGCPSTAATVGLVEVTLLEKRLWSPDDVIGR